MLTYLIQNLYHAHDFVQSPSKPQMTILGQPGGSSYDIPLLHGHVVTPPSLNALNNPPAGLLRWHYLQCVIKYFGTDTYKSVPNIALCQLQLARRI